MSKLPPLKKKKKPSLFINPNDIHYLKPPFKRYLRNNRLLIPPTQLKPPFFSITIGSIKSGKTYNTMFNMCFHLDPQKTFKYIFLISPSSSQTMELFIPFLGRENEQFYKVNYTSDDDIAEFIQLLIDARKQIVAHTLEQLKHTSLTPHQKNQIVSKNLKHILLIFDDMTQNKILKTNTKMKTLAAIYYNLQISIMIITHSLNGVSWAIMQHATFFHIHKLIFSNEVDALAEKISPAPSVIKKNDRRGLARLLDQLLHETPGLDHPLSYYTIFYERESGKKWLSYNGITTPMTLDNPDLVGTEETIFTAFTDQYRNDFLEKKNPPTYHIDPNDTRFKTLKPNFFDDPDRLVRVPLTVEDEERIGLRPEEGKQPEEIWREYQDKGLVPEPIKELTSLEDIEKFQEKMRLEKEERKRKREEKKRQKELKKTGVNK